MRRVAYLVAAAALFLAGCGPKITEDEAREAVMVAYQAVLTGSISAAAGSPAPGVSVENGDGSLRLDTFDLSGFDTPYQSISGTVGRESETIELRPGAAFVNMTLAGGPVETLSFVIDLAGIQTATTLSTTARVNGEEVEVEIRPESFRL